MMLMFEQEDKLKELAATAARLGQKLLDYVQELAAATYERLVSDFTQAGIDFVEVARPAFASN